MQIGINSIHGFYPKASTQHIDSVKMEHIEQSEMKCELERTSEQASGIVFRPSRFSFKSIMYICVYCVVIIVFGINKTDIHKIIMSLSMLFLPAHANTHTHTLQF